MIADTTSFDRGGTYWWSILDIYPKADLFF